MLVSDYLLSDFRTRIIFEASAIIVFVFTL